MSVSEVALLGAFDRFNYGDLLFPIVIEKALEKLGVRPRYAHYGFVRSDLSSFGAKPTEPMHRLFDGADAPPNVIVAGGEVLGANWTNMYLYASGKVPGVALRSVRKLLGVRASDRLTRTLIGTRTSFPWVLTPQHLDRDARIIYNAVGGSTNLPRFSAQQRKLLARQLEQAAYVSVRDAATQTLLRQDGVEAHLAPDSAVLMAEFFTREVLSELAVQTAALPNQLGGAYLCLQVNMHVGKDYVQHLVSALEAVYRRYQLPVLLLPIGRASLHEDQIPLSQIAASLTTPNLLAPLDISVYDIMHLIANATVFTGTSLHGAVTAFAFGVPHFALSRQVPKLLHYLETWDLPEQAFGATPEQLEFGIKRVLALPQSDLETARREVTARAWDNFVRIAEHLR